jgi:hypothetical protein
MLSTHNPFPGMNPFLERGWSDTHTLLIGYIRDALAQSHLPPGLRARAEEFLMVEEIEEDRHAARADVAIVESWKKGIPPTWSPGGSEGPATAVAQPKLVVRESGVERWVEITTTQGRLVTVIELLSPTNKIGPGRDRYFKKRATYEAAGVNVVEIDLLRGGYPTVAATAVVHTPGIACYTICVYRALRPDRFEVYHWGLRERIPAFAVPLRKGDPDVPLDLQPLVDRAYELGAYWQDDPAVERLVPPLASDEAAYAVECLSAAGLIEPSQE